MRDTPGDGAGTAGAPSGGRMRTDRIRAVVVATAIAIATLAAPAGAAAPQKFKATRPFVVDKQTGARRLPTAEEVDAIVVRLAALGPPEQTVPESTTANGTVRLALPRGAAGMILARPADDGAWETLCVFSLDEGAAFLGLVEVVE
jgi:hypothetical protein